MKLPYDSIIPLLGIWSGELKPYVHKSTQALFVLSIVKWENHPNAHQMMNGQIKCVISVQGDIILQ